MGGGRSASPDGEDNLLVLSLAFAFVSTLLVGQRSAGWWRRDASSQGESRGGSDAGVGSGDDI